MSDDIEKPVADYLRSLETATRALPQPQRRELLEEIRDHIRFKISGLKEPRPSDVLNILERLGDPARLADAAREEIPKPEWGDAVQKGAGASAHENGHGNLWLAIGAVVLTPLLWPLGALLLWLSPYWTTRDKWLGTLVLPGGLIGVYVLVSRFDLHERCEGHIVNGQAVTDGCTPPLLFIRALNILDVLLLILPLAVAAYLAIQLIRHRQPSPRRSAPLG